MKWKCPVDQFSRAPNRWRPRSQKTDSELDPCRLQLTVAFAHLSASFRIGRSFASVYHGSRLQQQILTTAISDLTKEGYHCVLQVNTSLHKCSLKNHKRPGERHRSPPVGLIYICYLPAYSSFSWTECGRMYLFACTASTSVWFLDYDHSKFFSVLHVKSAPCK